MTTKAKESAEIKKARKKLKDKLSSSDKKFTTKNLQKIAQRLEFDLERSAAERTQLRDKSIRLFDENKHPAGVQSKFVMRLMKELKAVSTKNRVSRPLGGRITEEA